MSDPLSAASRLKWAKFWDSLPPIREKVAAGEGGQWDAAVLLQNIDFLLEANDVKPVLRCKCGEENNFECRVCGGIVDIVEMGRKK